MPIVSGLIAASGGTDWPLLVLDAQEVLFSPLDVHLGPGVSR